VTAFVKEDAAAPPDFFAVEAEGLAWLAEGTEAGGPNVPRVLAVTPTRIEIERVDTGPWTPDADEHPRRLHRSAADAEHART
jgi:hypothetical protein